MKNSSRFEVTIARNFALSSSGVLSSSASASTRSLKSNQPKSRSIHTSDKSGDSSRLRTPSSPIDTMEGAALIVISYLENHYRKPPESLINEYCVSIPFIYGIVSRCAQYYANPLRLVHSRENSHHSVTGRMVAWRSIFERT